jgi:probable HAF family extracellular repeat protein
MLEAVKPTAFLRKAGQERALDAAGVPTQHTGGEKMKRLFAVTAALPLLGLSIAASAAVFNLGTGLQSLRFQVTDMGQGFYPTAINDSSEVAGFRSVDGYDHAFVWKNGGLEDMNSLAGGKSSRAYDINKSGQIVGYSLHDAPGYVNRDYSQARLWAGNTCIGLNIEHCGNEIDDCARAINDLGDVVGVADTFGWSGGTGAGGFIWRNGQITGALGAMFAPERINNAGVVCGETAGDAYNTRTAAIWQAGVTTLLPGLLPINPNAYTYATDINDLGQVVGYGYVETTALFWENNTVSDIGGLADSSDSNAYAINSSGAIVGMSYSSTGARATLWMDGGAHDLNGLIPDDCGWTLAYATDINSDGCIVGYGNYYGQTRAFLLSPVVPEPSSMIALVGGLAGLLGIRRRRA